MPWVRYRCLEGFSDVDAYQYAAKQIKWYAWLPYETLVCVNVTSCFVGQFVFGGSQLDEIVL